MKSNAVINSALANEPLVVIRIGWRNGGTKVYSTKAFDLTISGTQYQVLPRILSFGGLTTSERADKMGEVTASSITLHDPDDYIKTLMDTSNIFAVPVWIYHYHIPKQGTPRLILLFKGETNAPFRWEERKQEISLDVKTKIVSKQIGFRLNENRPFSTRAYNNEAAWNSTWPIIFGGVQISPALQLATFNEATTGEVLEQKVTLSEKRLFRMPDNTPVAVRFVATEYELPTIVRFAAPSGYAGSNKLVEIDNVLCSGSYTEDKLTVSDFNIPHYAVLSISSRPQDDPDANNPKVFWLQSLQNTKYPSRGEVNLVGLYIAVRYRTNDKVYGMVNKVTEQVENKIICEQDFVFEPSSQTILLGSEAAPIAEVWEACGRPHINWPIMRTTNEDTGWNWEIAAGTPVILDANTDLNIPYVYQFGNLADSVRGVWGVQDGSWKPIPNSAYSVFSVGDRHFLRFRRPPTQLPGGKWTSDEVAVMARGSLSNPVDIIEWALTNYTNLEPDATSFDVARPLLAKYRCNFTLTEAKDALEFCREVAWQARCVLNISQGKVQIKYASKESTPVYTLTDDDLEYDTINVTSLDSSDLVTKLTAEWKWLQLQSNNERRSFTNNLDTYGEYEKQEFMYSLAFPAQVEKTARFWLHRFSWYWKVLEVDTFLRGLPLDYYDVVALNTSFAPHGTKAIVLEAEYNPTSVHLKLLLPIPMGETDPREEFWDNSDESDPDFVVQLMDTRQQALKLTYEQGRNKLSKLYPFIGTTLGSETDGDIRLLNEQIIPSGGNANMTREQFASFYIQSSIQRSYFVVTGWPGSTNQGHGELLYAKRAQLRDFHAQEFDEVPDDIPLRHKYRGFSGPTILVALPLDLRYEYNAATYGGPLGFQSFLYNQRTVDGILQVSAFGEPQTPGMIRTHYVLDPPYRLGEIICCEFRATGTGAFRSRNAAVIENNMPQWVDINVARRRWVPMKTLTPLFSEGAVIASGYVSGTDMGSGSAPTVNVQGHSYTTAWNLGASNRLVAPDEELTADWKTFYADASTFLVGSAGMTVTSTYKPRRIAASFESKKVGSERYVRNVVSNDVAPYMFDVGNGPTMLAVITSIAGDAYTCSLYENGYAVAATATNVPLTMVHKNNAAMHPVNTALLVHYVNGVAYGQAPVVL